MPTVTLRALDLSKITFAPESITTPSGLKVVDLLLSGDNFLLQLNDERFKEDLYRCPYGLDTESELYPSPNTRTLRLRLPDDAHIKLRMMDDLITQQYAANHKKWNVPSNLEYTPLVKMFDARPMVKVKIDLNKAIIKRFNQELTAATEGSIEDINRNADCLLCVRTSGVWFNATRYGVTLKAMLIYVKPGQAFGLHNLVLAYPLHEGI